MTEEKKNSRIGVKLGLLAFAMFGFGYALVPLYNVLCSVTGINGKTGQMTESAATHLQVDQNRLVTVEFDTNVNSELPWSFKPDVNSMVVNPGKLTDVYFTVENNSDQAILAQAIPSVAPQIASLYFNKTECFCFSQQTLQPHERKDMLVRFVVVPGLPEEISTLTLSYTFFKAPESNETAIKKESNDLQQQTQEI